MLYIHIYYIYIYIYIYIYTQHVQYTSVYSAHIPGQLKTVGDSLPVALQQRRVRLGNNDANHNSNNDSNSKSNSNSSDNTHKHNTNDNISVRVSLQKDVVTKSSVF